MAPVERMLVKSLIAAPAVGETVKPGPVTIRGVAWAGEETSPKWKFPATTDDMGAGPFDGRRAALCMEAMAICVECRTPGAAAILCRAIDAQGEKQPSTSPWNPGGFLWNGWDRLSVTVAEEGWHKFFQRRPRFVQVLSVHRPYASGQHSLRPCWANCSTILSRATGYSWWGRGDRRTGRRSCDGGACLARTSATLILARCSVCHTPTYLPTAVTARRWTVTVEKMVHWGAEISRKELSSCGICRRGTTRRAGSPAAVRQ